MHSCTDRQPLLSGLELLLMLCLCATNAASKLRTHLREHLQPLGHTKPARVSRFCLFLFINATSTLICEQLEAGTFNHCVIDFRNKTLLSLSLLSSSSATRGCCTTSDSS